MSVEKCLELLSGLQPKPKHFTYSKLPIESRVFLLKAHHFEKKFLKFKQLKGKEFELEVFELDTILSLKHKAQQFLNLKETPKLLVKGKGLINTKTILDYKIDSVITLVGTEVSEVKEDVVLNLDTEQVQCGLKRKESIGNTTFQSKLKELLLSRYDPKTSEKAYKDVCFVLSNYE
jgi:hypothetical protein